MLWTAIAEGGALTRLFLASTTWTILRCLFRYYTSASTMSRSHPVPRWPKARPHQPYLSIRSGLILSWCQQDSLRTAITIYGSSADEAAICCPTKSILVSQCAWTCAVRATRSSNMADRMLYWDSVVNYGPVFRFSWRAEAFDHAGLGLTGQKTVFRGGIRKSNLGGGVLLSNRWCLGYAGNSQVTLHSGVIIQRKTRAYIAETGRENII